MENSAHTENAPHYVAYVSSYTMEKEDYYGIITYDVDLENGKFTEKQRVRITNSSYVTITHNRKFLYSITDFGVEAYKIMPDGSLEVVNTASINGMRGSYLSTDYTDRWLFVSGYHDGKITVLKLMEDGSVGPITDEIYHRGIGSVADRNFRPHVQCVKMTRDNRFLCAADIGLDHISVYRLDKERGRLKQIDIVHSDMESGPRHLKFSEDGRFMYVVNEIENTIDVFRYSVDPVKDVPDFERIQQVPTLNDYHATDSASSALNISDDFNYLVSSSAGNNSVVIFRIDQETGLLTKILCLPISGDYPKDCALFPDNRHLVSLNHESNTMTFFKVDLEKGLLIMNQKELHVDQPNCVIFHRLDS